MSQYFMLIKNRFIDFDRLMIEKYHLLDLNETDAIILIKLNNLLNQGKRKLQVEELTPNMSISANAISKRLVDLVKNGFITLSLSDVDSSEVFSLDETYRRLGNLLEGDDENSATEASNNLTREVVQMIEHEFNKILTPLELEIINHWMVEDKFSFDKIKDAVFECVKIKKYNVKYVDALLNQKAKPTVNKTQNNLQELFNNVYRRSKKDI